MPVLPLPVAMVQPSFRAPLVTAVGAAPLLKPGLGPAGGTAITLPAVTVPTDPEHRVAFTAAAKPRPARSHWPQPVLPRPRARATFSIRIVETSSPHSVSRGRWGPLLHFSVASGARGFQSVTTAVQSPQPSLPRAVHAVNQRVMPQRQPESRSRLSPHFAPHWHHPGRPRCLTPVARTPYYGRFSRSS